jgi:hypothetical protein
MREGYVCAEHITEVVALNLTPEHVFVRCRRYKKARVQNKSSTGISQLEF